MLTTLNQRKCQRGGILLTVALLLFMLFGFMGIAVDLGRLFVVKTELQTAMDSCALAAAQELDFQETSLSRARSAGISAGNLNPVNLQSANWSGQGQLTDVSFTFRDANFTPTTIPAQAKYVECQHAQPNIRMFLLHLMGAHVHDATAYPSTTSVGARAVATRVSAQTTCPIPIALKRVPGSAPPNYGFQVGQWVTVYGNREGAGGEFGWYNLDGSTNARSTREQLEEGRCGTEVGDELGTPGAKAGVHEAWNYRFGIYRNNVDPAEHRPDLSGYSYTAHNWRNAMPQNAFDGTPAPGSHSSAENFLLKRQNFRSFDDQGSSIQSGSTIVFNRANALNSFGVLATHGANGQHQQYGGNRRLATTPVIDENNRVIDYMCVFMLHPLTGPQDDAQIEVRGNAGTLTSPCTTSGLPGGNAGPLVPALVR